MARPEKKTPFRYAFSQCMVIGQRDMNSEKRDDRRKIIRESKRLSLGIFCEKNRSRFCFNKRRAMLSLNERREFDEGRKGKYVFQTFAYYYGALRVMGVL